MKIVFFGNGNFAINPLKTLINSNHNILEVITNVDKKSGRGLKLTSTPIYKIAKKNNLNVHRINNLKNKQFLKRLQTYNADIFIVIEYRILPEEIFNIAKFGTINIHASLLPDYKGASPIQRAIIDGESITGISSFFINNKIDSGKIIHNMSVKINNFITYGELYEKLSLLSGDFLLESLNNVRKNLYPDIINTTNKKLAPKIKKIEYKINLNDSAINIHNIIRGLTPPGPYVYLNNKRVKFINTDYTNKKNDLDVGFFKIINNLLYVNCKKGSLIVEKIQVEGKKTISANDFNNSYKNNNLKFE